MHYVAQFLWFLAITMIPIAEVVAIEFTGPVWVALLAVVALGEKMTAARVAAVALGVVGVVIIVRPGLDHVEVGQVVALLAAVGFAGSIILVKSLTRTESVVSIIFWMLVIQSVIGAIPAAMVWQTPPAAMWPWLAVIAVCGTYSHFCMAHALRHADATTVVPLDFLRVPLTAACGVARFRRAFRRLHGHRRRGHPRRQPAEPQARRVADCAVGDAGASFRWIRDLRHAVGSHVLQPQPARRFLERASSISCMTLSRSTAFSIRSKRPVSGVSGCSAPASYSAQISLP